MQVKIFDEESEEDLEDKINDFLIDIDDLIDIKYDISSMSYGEEQIYCFSAMIIYTKK